MIKVYPSAKDYFAETNEIANPDRVYTGQVVYKEGEGVFILASTRYLSDQFEMPAKLGAQLISLTDGNRWSEECYELLQENFDFKFTFSVSFDEIEDSFL